MRWALLTPLLAGRMLRTSTGSFAGRLIDPTDWAEAGAGSQKSPASDGLDELRTGPDAPDCHRPRLPPALLRLHAAALTPRRP